MSFRRSDYKYLFALGQQLYHSSSPEFRKQAATILMAMPESVIGNQVGWSNIPPRHRGLVTYPPDPSVQKQENIQIPFPIGE